MISKNIRNFYIVLMVCFCLNLIWFIGLYNNANDMLQYQYKEKTCLENQIDFFEDISDKDLEIEVSLYNYAFFGISFLALLFSVELLGKSFYEVFYK